MENAIRNLPTLKNKKLPCIFKVAISSTEYEFLVKKFIFNKISKRFYIYLDTNDSSKNAKFFHKNIRLRIKIKNSRYFLEFKKRGETKDEVLDEVSAEEFSKILEGVLPDGKVKLKLTELNMLLSFKPIDTVESERQKTNFHGGHLILEKTNNGKNGETSFQIEFRSEEIFSSTEINRLLTEELEVTNLLKDKTKLQKFWENR